MTHSSITQGKSHRNFDLDEFKGFVDDKLLSEDFSNLDLETMWDGIEKNISDYLEEKCPLHDIKIKFKGIPWITQEIMEVVQDRNRFNQVHYRLSKAISGETDELMLELLTFCGDSNINLRMLRYLRNTATKMN